MSGKQEAVTPRRSTRPRKLTAKAAASTSKRISNEKISEQSDSDDFEEDDNRPAVLHNNVVVLGEKIFTLQPRKKCEVVINETQKFDPKTPHALRNKFKKDIQSKMLEENDSSGADFSDSGSEYLASEEDTDETESPSGSGSDSDSPQPITKHKYVPSSKRAQTIQTRHNKNYTIKSDEYFSNFASKKVLTSNHTLDKLETPRLPQDQLHKLLSKMELRGDHATAITTLVKSSESCFFKWMYLLHENFNILVYGLGSKKEILDSFHQKCLKKLPTIVVNGFFPSLTIKDILDSIIVTLLELKENPGNIYEACDLIERELGYILNTHLYLIVHNIEMIRSGKAQAVFARLSSIKNLHLIASIDHINAPLIWDHKKLSKFNFTWWDVTNFQNYLDETSFESSMLVQRTGTLALSSLRNVFLSLTHNSKGIYLKLVKYQIENGKKQYYQGLAFKDLYSLCREAFLVSSDLALRAQLSEFVDHKMVKYKRSLDGTEYLVIPIQNTILQQFLTEHSS